MRIVRGVGLLALCALVALGCDDDGAGSGGDAGPLDGGGGDVAPAACEAAGTGTLAITITGLPAGVPASVTVASSGAPMTVTTSGSSMVSGGSYTVSARRVAGPADPVARAAYEPTITGTSGGAACVRAGMTTTVTVSYALIATSNKLWLSNGNGMATLLAYTPATLAATGMPAAAVAAGNKSGKGITFDPAGNLWALGATVADAPLARYPAASLAASGTKVPDVEIDSPSFGAGSPGPHVLAFDSTGNLWTTVGWADKVVRFTPAQIAASGSPTPAVEIAGLNAPSALAFDMTGNLWLIADDKVMRIDAARLGASGSGPDLTIELQRPAPVTGMIRAGEGLAFDKDGNLWVNAGLLCRLTPADLAGTGMKSLAPGVQIEMTVTALPVGLAFDESAALWVAYSNGSFARYTSAQLGASGMPAPEVIITSADVGHADFFGIYPAPAALPLHHRLP